MFFFKFFKVLNLKNSLTFQIEQFRIFDYFLNQSIIAIWNLELENVQFSKFDTFIFEFIFSLFIN